MDIILNYSPELIQRMGLIISQQIVDDFRRIQIFSVEESSFILSDEVDQRVARRLIDILLKKGNTSCVHFLEFLKTRDPYFYEDLLGQCAISVGVNEEELDMLAEDLKNLYTAPVFQRFYPLGKKTGIDILFDMEETFTEPKLWVKNTKNDRVKGLNLDELLNGFKRSPCVIEGEAGKGKTTILKKIAVLWATGECPALKRFQLVFFITLSSASEGLYETLCDQLFSVDKKWSKKAFMEKIWKLREKVLFLLDGYDEFQSQNCPDIEFLIKENHKYKSMVILSIRTEAIREVRKYTSIITETGDFTQENAAQLIRNVLYEAQANDLLSLLAESAFMNNLMKTPLFVIIACALQMGESDFQLNTQTTLFCTLYDLLVEKSREKLTNRSNDFIAENIRFCGDLALDGLFKHQFDFYEGDLLNIEEEILLNIGLLNKYTAQRLKVVYKFFHTSFQEYVAGRRLSELLSSDNNSEVAKGNMYLIKINSIFDITTKYNNLLLYTCGSSKISTRKVLEHMARVYENDTDSHNPEFVEFGVSLFYESSTKSTLSEDFENFFRDKTLLINPYNISSQHTDFFQFLPNCLNALNLIHLDLCGNCNTSDCLMDGNTDENPNVCNINEKIVKLFFDHRQNIQTLEVTLKNFNDLSKKDVKYLGKICSSANRLRLNIQQSAGITGTLTDVLKTCKNMQDLIVDSTPLNIEDERQIVDVAVMKTLSIMNVQTEHQPGGLLYGLFKLQGIEKLVLQNIKLTENDADMLASGIKHLNKLRILQLSDVPEIGKGMDFIAEAISNTCCELEDLKLTNCCLTGRALKTISQSMITFPNLQMIDFSNNYLEEDGEQSMMDFAQALTPVIKTLLLPGGSRVAACLDTLLEKLTEMHGLTKLGFKRWNLTDDDIAKLASALKNNFQNLSFLDLSENCATNEGWLTLTKSLRNLKDLTHLNFSTQDVFVPDSFLVIELSRAISQLNVMSSIEVVNWVLDDSDLRTISNANTKAQVKKAIES
ncbi:NLR family CARD domain-containing protein 4 [Bombina bombina]|uniref:NLR family CARD domain-containing protein 4 n=1 Tax=Bombina bombina TaxID=8345 RepID=UPI00235B03B3|nr:NLR family CARD domain-containing protein 4 [Bombina bombina]